MTIDDAVGLGRLLLVLAEIATFLVAGGYAVSQFFEFVTLGYTGNAFADPGRKAAGMARLGRMARAVAIMAVVAVVGQVAPRLS